MRHLTWLPHDQQERSGYSTEMLGREALGGGTNRESMSLHLLLQQRVIWKVGIIPGIPYLVFLVWDWPQISETVHKEAYWDSEKWVVLSWGKWNTHVKPSKRGIICLGSKNCFLNRSELLSFPLRWVAISIKIRKESSLPPQGTPARSNLEKLALAMFQNELAISLRVF